MTAGKLRHRVQLQVPLEDRDDLGGVRTVWMTMDELWADIEPLKGKEVFEAASIEGRLSHRITLRAYAGFDTRWRLVWPEQDRAFQVYSAKDVQERHRVTELLCMEILT